MKKILPVVLVGLLIIVFLFPVRLTCGAPNMACARPPIPGVKEEPGYYYEVEPFGVYLLENLTRSNITIYYSNSTR